MVYALHLHPHRPFHRTGVATLSSCARPTLTLAALFAALFAATAGNIALAQSSPAFGPLGAASAATSTDAIPLADYLGFLRQIAPAAEQGARTYLAAVKLRCGRVATTDELRQAISDGDGHPALMGLIRAAHGQDKAARDRWVAQIQCPPGAAR